MRIEVILSLLFILGNNKVFAKNIDELLESYRPKIISACIDTNKDIKIYAEEEYPDEDPPGWEGSLEEMYTKEELKAPSQVGDICVLIVRDYYFTLIDAFYSHKMSFDDIKSALEVIATRVVPLYINTKEYYTRGYYDLAPGSVSLLASFINTSIEENDCHFFKGALYCE